MNASIDRRVEDERVDSDECQQDQLGAEGRVRIVLCCLCPEKEKTAYEHDGEAGPGERKDGTCDPSDGDGTQHETKHTEIEQRDSSKEQGDAKDMNRLDD